MDIKNKVWLVTYPESLGGDLNGLSQALEQFGIFESVHILPPFVSSGDRGFAPVDYYEIDQKFGDWQQIKKLGEKYNILIDLMVNHVSQKSKYFQDFLENGKDSMYYDMFIPLTKIWKEDSFINLDKIVLRRTLPYSTFKIKKTGKEETVWTTFGKEEPSEQIDIDVNSYVTKQMIKDIFILFSENNINIVRLDAVGYVIKKAGTSCFFVEPEIDDFLDYIKEVAQKFNIELLPELHSHYTTQNKLSQKGFWIYDFILPYLIIQTIINKNAIDILKYLKERPTNMFTLIDCHDGIPVKPDLDDIIDEKTAREVVDTCVKRGSALTLVLSDEHKSKDGFDVHQICGTFYSMLDENDDAYMAARAMQFFAPGVPQVYYVGFLAGTNDYERAKTSEEPREMNRHNYTKKEIEQSLKKPIVKRFVKLIEFRNSNNAFGGQLEIYNAPNDQIKLRMKNGKDYCELSMNLLSYKSIIKYNDDHGNEIIYNI